MCRKRENIYVLRKMINSNFIANNFKRNNEKINEKIYLIENSNLITSAWNNFKYYKKIQKIIIALNMSHILLKIKMLI